MMQLHESSLPPALCLNWLNKLSTADPDIRNGDMKYPGYFAKKFLHESIYVYLQKIPSYSRIKKLPYKKKHFTQCTHSASIRNPFELMMHVEMWGLNGFTVYSWLQ